MSDEKPMVEHEKSAPEVLEQSGNESNRSFGIFARQCEKLVTKLGRPQRDSQGGSIELRSLVGAGNHVRREQPAGMHIEELGRKATRNDVDADGLDHASSRRRVVLLECVHEAHHLARRIAPLEDPIEIDKDERFGLRFVEAPADSVSLGPSDERVDTRADLLPSGARVDEFIDRRHGQLARPQVCESGSRVEYRLEPWVDQCNESTSSTHSIGEKLLVERQSLEKRS